jgi:hypothetical protein
MTGCRPPSEAKQDATRQNQFILDAFDCSLLLFNSGPGCWRTGRDDACGWTDRIAFPLIMSFRLLDCRDRVRLPRGERHRSGIPAAQWIGRLSQGNCLIAFSL